MDSVESIERATAFAEEKVRGVQAQDMGKPTPCADFDVKALLNHLIGNLGMLVIAARGEKSERPEGDQFETDPGAVYGERRQELLVAIAPAGVFDREWHLPFADMPGALMASIAFMEHLTHGWDVAQATGQDTTIPADLVEPCMHAAMAVGDTLRMPGVCGPAVAVPDEASAQDRLIAFMGRTP
jgi:uncharacterized protein (TIGR03086 family)